MTVIRKKFKGLRQKSYVQGHATKGKTYLEIYGTSTPACGFKTGLENPNFTHLRQRKFGTFKYVNKIGEKYRSSLEVTFSEYCIDNEIPYISEVILNLVNGKRKIVDFVLYDHIIVEITGFAYTQWREKFIGQIKVLRKSIDNPILILTYDQNLITNSLIYECRAYDVFIAGVTDYKSIVKKLKLFNIMLHANSMIDTNLIETRTLNHNTYKKLILC